MSPAAPEDFAEALRAAMNRRPEMSNGAVARAAGIDQSHLYKLLGGTVPHPQPRTIKRLADALDAPELLKFSGSASRLAMRARLEATEEALDRVSQELAELRSEFEQQRQGDPPPAPEDG